MSPPSSGSKINRARNQLKNRWQAEHVLSRWFLAQLILRPWRWRRTVSPKRRLLFNGLHGVISQKIKLFLTRHFCTYASEVRKTRHKDNRHLKDNTGKISAKTKHRVELLYEEMVLLCINNITDSLLSPSEPLYVNLWTKRGSFWSINCLCGQKS
jgi:hypothetical protein